MQFSITDLLPLIGAVYGVEINAQHDRQIQYPLMQYTGFYTRLIAGAGSRGKCWKVSPAAGREATIYDELG